MPPSSDPANLIRCRWASNEWNIPYHDEEWGVPLHDDRKWFELLILEGAQAGLSWDTVLRKAATIINDREFLKIQQEFGSFDRYVWRFVDGKPKQNAWKHKLPAQTKESDALSKDLAKRGFRFVGSTICYALMQATGMVNDHAVTCYRYQQLGGGSH